MIEGQGMNERVRINDRGRMKEGGRRNDIGTRNDRGARNDIGMNHYVVNPKLYPSLILPLHISKMSMAEQ